VETQEIFFILSLSISFPVVACLIIYNRIDKIRFPIYPIFICSILGLIMELGAFMVGKKFIFAIILNLYTLLEFILVQIQFYLWTKHLQPSFPYKSITLGVLIWIFTVFYMESIGQRNVPFIIIYSFGLVVLSIQIMNKLIVSNKSLVKNFLVLICISYIVTYSVAILTEFFCIYDNLFSVNFIMNVFYIKSVLNALSNLVIAIAIICIPKKQQYSVSF
jgi:hypothetical protein